MSSVTNALRVDADEAASFGVADRPNVGALLTALSTVLQDTLGRFEQISGRVTENVLQRGQSADHDLIVALQDFDRLQQEFSALSNVISYCASASNADGNPKASSVEVIAAITLADLKDRLLSRLQAETSQAAFAPVGCEQEF